jgi:hypothetical protein
MLNNLNFGIRKPWRDYLVARLTQSARVVQLVRSNAHVKKLLPAGKHMDTVTDYELLGSLIDITIRVHDAKIEVEQSEASDIPDDLSAFEGSSEHANLFEEVHDNNDKKHHDHRHKKAQQQQQQQLSP